MARPEQDQSIHAEPHLRSGHTIDPSEQRAEAILARGRPREQHPDERIEHTVWSEPWMQDVPRSEQAVDEARWLRQRRAETSAAKTWLITVLVCLASGGWAVVGALLGTGRVPVHGMLVAVIAAPVVEELMKIALPLWVVEKRPFYFRSRGQIVVCAAAAGLIFATIENLLYLYVYIPEPSAALARWRWSVCTALHMGCAVVGSLGVIRIWDATWEAGRRAPLHLVTLPLIVAMVIHGLYNLAAVVVAIAAPDRLS